MRFLEPDDRLSLVGQASTASFFVTIAFAGTGRAAPGHDRDHVSDQGGGGPRHPDHVPGGELAQATGGGRRLRRPASGRRRGREGVRHRRDRVRGRQAAARLRERGDEVVAFVRDLGKAGRLRELGCTIVEGDLLAAGARSGDGEPRRGLPRRCDLPERRAALEARRAVRGQRHRDRERPRRRSRRRGRAHRLRLLERRVRRHPRRGRRRDLRTARGAIRRSTDDQGPGSPRGQGPDRAGRADRHRPAGRHLRGRRPHGDRLGLGTGQGRRPAVRRRRPQLGVRRRRGGGILLAHDRGRVGSPTSSGARSTCGTRSRKSFASRRPPGAHRAGADLVVRLATPRPAPRAQRSRPGLGLGRRHLLGPRRQGPPRARLRAEDLVTGLQEAFG